MLYKQVVQTQCHPKFTPHEAMGAFILQNILKRPSSSSRHSEGARRMSPAVALHSTRAESQRPERESLLVARASENSQSRIGRH